MDFKKIDNKGKARLFESEILESLTKTHPVVIWTLYMPIIIFLLYYSFSKLNMSVIQIAINFVEGLISWSLTEYLLHRFVFHYHHNSKIGSRINYIIHGNHHEYPRDKERLFMPPAPSIIIASSFFGFFYFCFELKSMSFFPGFIFGYLMYGTMHYAIHAGNPPFKWMKGLWRNHHLHHYAEANKGFGVSSTLWDHLLGTMYEKRKK
jgi:sterol desaturase/sphingolipid hydroxylase (fatty acid hydroxylase superfamily)